MHQTFHSVPHATLLKAIGNGQLLGFLCMDRDTVTKYLAPLSATPKRRMKRPRVGIPEHPQTDNRECRKNHLRG